MKKFHGGIAVLLAFCCIILGTIGGFIGWIYFSEPITSDIYVSGDLQVHFLELGNKYTGDCTYIKVGDVDILIDAGSRSGSIQTIDSYLDKYVSDNTLEYVIVTHAHEDHYAGFATNENVDSLFDLFECKTIIDFALTNQKEDGKLYSNYQRELTDEITNGAIHYTAKDCIELGKQVFTLTEGITMTILDQRYYYEAASSENDYSVCTLISYGEEHFLFTGDLEEKGEKSLIEKNQLPQISVYKAGHHGSKTSSTHELMAVVKPEVICVCCCAGSPEYTKTPENQFPTQEFIDRVAPYTDKIYVTTLNVDYANNEFTSMNGNITVSVAVTGIKIECSASDLKLKDTEWFKENRETPDNWK